MQLLIGVACMSMVANLQYGWTLFVNPIEEKFHWGSAVIQVFFVVFILCETWFSPILGAFTDRIGPRLVVFFGGILCAVAWCMNALADSINFFSLAAVVGGIGAGAVYSACVGNALRWFPDRRGLAVGITAAGYGAGSALTVIPITNMIAAKGYQETFLIFGLCQGAVIAILALFLKGKGRIEVLNEVGVVKNYRSMEMIKEPAFWVMYLMFVMVGGGGLVITAQFIDIAKSLNFQGVDVVIFGVTLSLLMLTLNLNRVLNGLTRPIFGWISDLIGREKTMFICFNLEALSILGLYYFGHTPAFFLLLTGLVFFLWGEIYSLFPSINADTFGDQYAAGNAGLLYTAKGTASLLVPLSSILAAATGSWEAVFWGAGILNFLAALLAWFILRPLRRKLVIRNRRRNR